MTCRILTISSGGHLRKFGRTRVGHRFWQIDDRLFFVVKRRRCDKRICFAGGQTESVANKIKAAVRRERRRGQNARFDLVKELFLKKSETSTGDACKKTAAAAAFEPVDEISVSLFDDKAEIEPRLPYAANDALGLGYFFRINIDLGLKTRQCVVESVVCLAKRGRMVFAVAAASRQMRRRAAETALPAACLRKS